MKKPEMFFVCDIETSGQCFATGSIASIGCVPVADGGRIGFLPGRPPTHFYAKLHLRKDTKSAFDDSTLRWWLKQDFDAFQEAFMDMDNRLNPQEAMFKFAKYVQDMAQDNYKPIFVSKPVGFDFAFVRDYFFNYTGNCPFGHNALDVRSLAMGLFPHYDYAELSGEEMDSVAGVAKLVPALKPHNALNDAIMLARTFASMMDIRKASR